jgi:type VI secretion system secreted protein Hcp
MSARRGFRVNTAFERYQKMPAFMKLGDIQGESTDQGHKGWILLESLSMAIHRSVAPGAKDNQRSRGETTPGDVVVVRQLDKSSVKMQEACASGKFFDDVEVHFCTQVKNKAEPYLKYKLSNVIITSYGFHGNAASSPQPSEEATLGYTKAEWTYVELDPKTGDPKGNVVGKFDMGAHASN